MSFSHAEHGDAERRNAQFNYAMKSGFKGAAGGLAVTGPGAYFLHRTWTPFQRLTLPLKTMFVTMATVAIGVIAADKAGIAFDQEHYSDEGARKIRQYASERERQWDQLSTFDKALTWTKDNKFSIVAGSWVASMGGIFAYIHKQPMTTAQKLVQTRVWAQGITLASLVGMAAITQIPSAGDKLLYDRDHAADHSWRDFIHEDDDDEGKKEKANKALSKSKPSQKSKKADASAEKEKSSEPKEKKN